MGGKPRLFFTRNFAANLDTIESFLAAEGRSAFQHLLNRVFDDICPKLSKFPLSGRSFLEHRPGSSEGQALLKRLQEKLRTRDDQREFVVDDYVILYLIRKRRIYLLAIKHHRQLSFDLLRFWS